MKYCKKDAENLIINCISELLYEKSEYRDDFIICFTKIKSFSNELYFHSLKVALLTLSMAVQHYQCKDTLKDMFIAAMLHDYGKIYISRSILEKKDTLTRDERKTIELHSIAGYFYLRQQTCFNERILDAVLDHHEKVDGSGYGLCKTTTGISDYAKYIAIADVYDAMISARVYRGPLDKGVASKYLIENAGKHFDGSLVKDFITIINEVNIDDLMNRVISVMHCAEIA